MDCGICGSDIQKTGHDCHCISVGGIRVAVGICCGREVGEGLLREEDYHDNAPWSVKGDCTCDGGPI